MPHWRPSLNPIYFQIEGNFGSSYELTWNGSFDKARGNPLTMSTSDKSWVTPTQQQQLVQLGQDTQERDTAGVVSAFVAMSGAQQKLRSMAQWLLDHMISYEFPDFATKNTPKSIITLGDIHHFYLEEWLLLPAINLPTAPWQLEAHLFGFPHGSLGPILSQVDPVGFDGGIWKNLHLDPPMIPTKKSRVNIIPSLKVQLRVYHPWKPSWGGGEDFEKRGNWKLEKNFGRVQSHGFLWIQTEGLDIFSQTPRWSSRLTSCLESKINDFRFHEKNGGGEIFAMR